MTKKQGLALPAAAPRGRKKEQKMNRHSANRIHNLLCLFIGLVGLISAVVFILKEIR